MSGGVRADAGADPADVARAPRTRPASRPLGRPSRRRAAAERAQSGRGRKQAQAGWAARDGRATRHAHPDEEDAAAALSGRVARPSMVAEREREGGSDEGWGWAAAARSRGLPSLSARYLTLRSSTPLPLPLPLSLSLNYPPSLHPPHAASSTPNATAMPTSTPTLAAISFLPPSPTPASSLNRGRMSAPRSR